MCYQPNEIKNPNYGKYHLRKFTNVDSPYIMVPCGHCGQCRSRKQTDLIQRVQMLSKRYYPYMFTLTYSEDMVPLYTFSNVETGESETVRHLQFSDLTNMFKRIRKANSFGERRFKYLACGEYGSKGTQRPHYHGIMFVEKLPEDTAITPVQLESVVSDTLRSEWRRNIATTVAKKDTKKYRKGEIIPNTRRPIYKPLSEFKEKFVGGKVYRTFDCHLITCNEPGSENDCTFYVCKYMFKDCPVLKKYFALCQKYNPGCEADALRIYHTIFKPKSRKSLNFGLLFTDDSYSEYLSTKDKDVLVYDEEVLDKITSDIKKSQDSDLCNAAFYDIYTGKGFPLCKFYLDRLPSRISNHVKAKTQIWLRSHPIERSQAHDAYARARYEKSASKVFVTDVFDIDI